MRAGLFLLLIVTCLAGAGEAIAHSGPIEPRALRTLPDAGDVRMLATSFGLVRTLDAQTWDVICSEAIGYDEALEPVLLHWAADGAVFVGSLKGLFISRDGACSWAAHPDFSSRGASDITPAPASSTTLYVASGKFGAANGLFRSTDSGQTFTPVLTRADTFFTGIRFSPSTSGRAYASAWYFSPPAAWIFRSDDGLQFTEVTPSTPFVSAFSVVAVSPTDASLVFASAYDDSTGEYVLLRSADEGATFAEVARDAKAFRDVVFSSDGLTVWATAARLFVSSDAGATFVLSQATQRSFCASWVDEALYICADQRFDGYALGEWTGDGGVEKRMSFRDIRGPLECPAGTPTHDVCGPLWPALQVALFLPPAGDGGTQGDGGTGDGGVTDGGTGGADGGADGDEDPPPSGCGCGTSGASGLLPPLLAAVVAVALRRRARGTIGAAVVAACVIVASGCGPVKPPCEACAPVTDPCDPNPCSEENRTRCEDVGGVAQCGCVEGTVERSGACVVPDPCDPNPCTRPHETVCTLVGSAATCSCEEGYEPTAGGCRERIDCMGQHSEGDAFEPDECPELARDIGVGGDQLEPHSFAPAGDEDWFRVDAVQGRIYRVRAAGPLAPALRANVYLGDELLELGTERVSTEALAFALKVPSSGALYFRLRAAAASATGEYEVSIGDRGTDDHGDEAASATSIAPGVIQQGSIQFNDDVDVLSFVPGQPGHAWELRAEATSGASPVELKLTRGASPEPVRTSAGSTATVLTRLTTTEPHFVHLVSGSGGFDQGWVFIATDLGADDHGDVATEATTIVPGGPEAAASVDRAGDEDVFRFEAISGHIYRFTCTPSGVPHCLVTIRDASGAVIGSDLDGGAAVVTHEYVAGGPHFVHVQSASGDSGAYAYKLEDLGKDDHGDDPNAATVLGMPPVMGQLDGTSHLETSGDRDFLRFTADGDHIYRISCTRKTIGDCVVRVFSLAGLPVAQDANGGDGVTYYEFLGGGDYFVELSTLGGQTGTMDWQILDLFHDDHGDDAVTATSMLANSAWVQGEIQLPAEKDFFKFDAVAGRQYRVSCQRQALGDCVMRLYSPSNAVLAMDIDGGDAMLVHTAGASGFHAIQIIGSGPQMGTYLVKVEDLGP